MVMAVPTHGDTSDVTALVANCAAHLGPAGRWRNPALSADSLALCIIDATWAPASPYDYDVAPALDRYRAYRRSSGVNPLLDTPRDLAGLIRRMGGPGELARLLSGTRSRSWAAARRGEAVLNAADLLAGRAVRTSEDLAERADDESLREAWRRLPGQRSAATGFGYLLLVAGVADEGASGWVRGFVARAVGRPVSVTDARAAVHAAAWEFGVSAGQLAQRIWLWEVRRICSEPMDA